uniref:Uncharacterized protein n=1 Tax=Trichogramma kaykai TaxID=54128 RepID=A0ABD2VW71_9HYME
MPAIPTRIGSTTEIIAVATRRLLLSAPLLPAKGSPLLTPTDFATGSYEEKWKRIEGLVSGLADFVRSKGNLHKEVTRYTLSLV